MTVKELRVGNYIKQIKYLNGDCNEVRKVASVNKEGFLNVEVLGQHTMKSHPIEWFVPLDLSEEILLKVGFDKEVNSSISSSSTWFYLPDFPLRKAGGFAKPMYYNLGTYDGVKIYTLHQLQNLYFSLTGQELNTTGLI